MTVKPAPLTELFARMQAQAAGGEPEACSPPDPIPVSVYTDTARCEAEKKTVFSELPLMLAHASELPDPGSVLRVDVAGRPIVLSRDAQGQVHAHLNVCRHRGMRLLDQNGPCQRKTLVCPYHGWTYELDGRLRHTPHPEFFPQIEAGSHDLTRLACAEAHGLIWVVPMPGVDMDIDAWLGPLGPELEYFGSREFTLYRRSESVHAANWKLIIDAFQEAYHIRVLHRDTVYRFFMDAMAVGDTIGPHTRSCIARRKLEEAPADPAQADLREHCSITHFVFPNLITVNHPDYSSLLSFFPEAPDRLRYVHHMLVPPQRLGETEHWEKTYQLIEGGVFQSEDLYAAESIQAGLSSGANREITLGTLEDNVARFHQMVERVVQGEALPSAGA